MVSQRKEEKEVDVGSRVNVVLPAKDRRDDDDGVQSEEFLVNGIDVRDSQRVVDDEGAEGTVMFDVRV